MAQSAPHGKPLAIHILAQPALPRAATDMPKTARLALIRHARLTARTSPAKHPAHNSDEARMRTFDVDILLLPGWTNSGPDHWQTRWQSRLKTARRVEQDDWDRVKQNSWTERVIDGGCGCREAGCPGGPFLRRTHRRPRRAVLPP